MTSRERAPGETRRAPDALDRRTVLRAMGLGGAGLALGGLGLAGCSDDDGGRSSTASSTTGTTGTTAPPVSLPPHDPDRPYWVQGGFRPVTTEETITDLTITGTLPAALSGLFVRNGSNASSRVEPAHWFLADGMVHGVRLQDGAASWYRNRWVATPQVVEGDEAAPRSGPPGGADNQSNVAVIHHAGKLLTLGEVGWPYQLSTDDLSTVGPWDFDGRLGPTMTAHPKIDPATGRLHFFGYEIARPTLTYYVADADGRLDLVSPLTLDVATMVHDFAITDRHAIFWIGPVVFGPDPANPYPDVPFHWDPAAPSRVGVLPLDGGADEVRWLDLDPLFAFHGLNAHQDGEDDIVLRLSTMPEAFSRLGDLPPSHLTEWRIGTGGESLTLSETRLFERPLDLPSHDRRFTGRETRHGWLVTTTEADSEHGFELEGLVHVDLRTGREQRWDPGPDRRAGEGFFVPDSDDAAEGEGWLLTYVWDRTTDRSALAVFDAQEVQAGPVAEVPLPVRVPFGFHGWWVGEADL